MKQSKLKCVFIIITITMIFTQFSPDAMSCSSDFNNDGAVDGKEIHSLSQIPTPSSTNYLEIAQQFGKTDCEIMPEPQIVFTANPQITDGDTPSRLAWSVLYADTVTIEPGIGNSGVDSEIDVTPQETTEYTLTAIGKGGITQKTLLVIIDKEAPEIVSFEPVENGQVNFEDLQTGILMSFTDNTGVTSAKVYKIDGETEIDMTPLASIGGNLIQLDISNLPNGAYQFKIVLTDSAGNETVQLLKFTLDKILPETFPSVAGGIYENPLTVDLGCSEQATIYYSTDGSPPFEGGENTISGPAPIRGININPSISLQFFAKDTFGNVEKIKNIIYSSGNIPETLTGLVANYNNPNVNLSWNPNSSAFAYRTYRALNKLDIQILRNSQKYGYPPPKRLRYSETDISSGTTTFADTNILSGLAYYYGVTQINSAHVESAVSDLAFQDIPESSSAMNNSEAIERALSWLEYTQNKNGSWGNKESIKMVATSQVLNAYKIINKFDLNTQHALFYLRGTTADNNDYLARKILTLNSFGQNTNLFINKLYASGGGAYGWGVERGQVGDALTSTLALKAIKCISYSPIAANVNCGLVRYYTELQCSYPANRFGWKPQTTNPSIYVSSIVYNSLNACYPEEAPVFESTWITESQAVDGSFGNGLIDTSSVILWISPLSTVQKQDAMNFLVSQQSPNGSWNNDPYVTGLCLEALLKQ